MDMIENFFGRNIIPISVHLHKIIRHDSKIAPKQFDRFWLKPCYLKHIDFVIAHKRAQFGRYLQTVEQRSRLLPSGFSKIKNQCYDRKSFCLSSRRNLCPVCRAIIVDDTKWHVIINSGLIFEPV